MTAVAAHFSADALSASPMLAHHFDDFLAPFLLLTVVYGLARWHRQAWLLSGKSTIGIMGFAILLWEGAAPFLLEQSTADGIDVLAYSIGAATYFGLCKFAEASGGAASANRHQPSTINHDLHSQIDLGRAVTRFCKRQI